MFKIGDFSKITHISVRMLRYYENKSILIPAKIDEESKYRWYSVSQIKEVNKIKVLRDMGFLVDEIKELLYLNENDFIIAIQEQKTRIHEEIIRQKQRIRKLDILENSITVQDMDLEYEVQIKSIPEKVIYSYRQIIEDYYDEGKVWEILGMHVKQNNIKTLEEDSIAIYHNSEDIDVEVAVVVPEVIETKLPFQCRVLSKQDKMASIMAYGSFDTIGPRYQELAYWIDKNHYEIIGDVREIPINGPWNRDNEDEYLTEIQVPIKK